MQMGGGQGKFVSLCDEPVSLLTNNSIILTDNALYHLDIDVYVYL